MVILNVRKSIFSLKKISKQLYNSIYLYPVRREFFKKTAKNCVEKQKYYSFGIGVVHPFFQANSYDVSHTI